MQNLNIYQALDALLQIHDWLTQAKQDRAELTANRDPSQYPGRLWAHNQRMAALMDTEGVIMGHIITLCQKAEPAPQPAPIKTGLGKLPPPPPELTGKVRYAKHKNGFLDDTKFVAFCDGCPRVYAYIDGDGYKTSIAWQYDNCLEYIEWGVWVELDPETGEVKQ